MGEGVTHVTFIMTYYVTQYMESNISSHCHQNYGAHRRTGQHPFGGGQATFCPNGFSGGGVVVAEIFRDPHYSMFCGGGGSSRIFPGSIFCGVAEIFQLTAVTDPKFDFFSVNCSNRP